MGYKKKISDALFKKEWDKGQSKFKQGNIILKDDAEELGALRDLKVLQGLAASEFEDSLVVLESKDKGSSYDGDTKNYSNPANGFIHLEFTKKDTEQLKKIVTMHEARHLTITPAFDDLSPTQQQFVEDHKQLINILEDVRVNRSLCFKYPGLPRYYDSELSKFDNPFFGLSIGDIVNQDIKDVTSVPPQIAPLFMFKDEVRECLTFEDVLKVAAKIVQFFKLPKEQQNKKMKKCQQDQNQKDQNPTGSDCFGGCNPSDDDSDDDGDGKGDSDEEGDQDQDKDKDGNKGDDKDEDKDGDGNGGDNDDKEEEKKQKKPKDYPGSSEHDLNDFLDKLSKNDDNSQRLFDSNNDQIHGRRGGPSDGELKITKRDKSTFLGTHDDYKTFRIAKHTLKKLKKECVGWRVTREGRLNKVTLNRLYSGGMVFKRKTFERTNPKAYIVLDGSGSMWGKSREWQKGASESLANLFDTIGIEYRIFIHSGDYGEFYYSEIEKKDIGETSSLAMTLDGSMLQALFEYEIPQNEKCMIFYFSDGGIAAQYENVQVPLLEKYNILAEKRGAPIFGIGIETADVDVFRHWFVMKNSTDLPRILDKIGNLLGRYIN